jgi:uncharacterized protein
VNLCTTIRLVIVLLLFQFGAVNAQTVSDIDLIKSQTFVNPKFESHRIVKFGISETPNRLVKYNPISLSLSALLFTYQQWLSRQISADCLYSPTCSEYSKQLFKRYGIVRGLITSSDRLMRCDRISATTIHPISVDEHDGKVHESVERYKLHK